MLKHYFILGFALIAGVIVAVAMREPLTNDGGRVDHSKYLKFSHKFHVDEQGIACEDCHNTVRASTSLSKKLLGDHASCQTCHEEQLTNDCAFCHTTPDDIVPIPHATPELIFSHEIHMAQNLKCQSCHTGIENVELGSSAPTPSMTSCMTCHTEQKISTNCETCHTNFASLVPDDHLVANFRRSHKELARIAMMDVSCAACHTSESFCQDCHSGAELMGFGLRRDLMTDPSVRSSVKDSPKQLRLQQVHGLNYRFTHGIDAKSRLYDCSSCHEQQSFCAACHQAGGNVTQSKFKPQNHVPGFATLPGTNGGPHAQLARRDIENCMTCHDVQGNDPTCFMCHTDAGAVR